ncbi:MAG: hypothetical protein RL254_1589 [Planctomycetota bacterium]
MDFRTTTRAADCGTRRLFFWLVKRPDRPDRPDRLDRLDRLTQSILARLFLALLSWLVDTTWNVAFFGPVGGATAQVEFAGHGLSVSELADDL